MAGRLQLRFGRGGVARLSGPRSPIPAYDALVAPFAALSTRGQSQFWRWTRRSPRKPLVLVLRLLMTSFRPSTVFPVVACFRCFGVAAEPMRP
jgi:hypothetical protein